MIRFSSIGDIVLTTPVVRCVKQQLGAEVHFLTKRSFEKIVQSNPHIDRVFSIEKKVSEVINVLKAENYDCIVDLHGNLRTLQVKLALGVKSYSFDKLNFRKWLITNFKINYLPSVHIVDRYLKTVESLGVKNDGKGLDFFIPETDVISDFRFQISDGRFQISDFKCQALDGEFQISNVKFQELKTEFQASKVTNSISNVKYIAFVIGAAHATKRLPVEKIAAICNKIALPIFLIGGKEDAERGALICAESSSKIVNLCGQLNLNQSASVVQQARKVITHDTGLMHIAAAFGKDIISIWGSTIPEFGMTPYLPTEGSRIVEVKEVSCRPCSKIGHNQCPKGHFNCMQQIDIEAVVSSIVSF
ncbi:MAG: glycosyltransferase family 9 protein [Saprospiraceae bacterium]|nr:glycosyltransferase family 9 protein [Saprospiraceae bacterium]